MSSRERWKRDSTREGAKPPEVEAELPPVEEASAAMAGEDGSWKWEEMGV